jgi:hypothetical protein
MKKYLLLRNNKQSGPYTSEELLALGLKSQDLLWVEGKSASWRYPSEFDEFKVQSTILQELPSDPAFTNIQNDIFLYRPEMAMTPYEFPDDELSEFPTLALFLDPETLKRQGKTPERTLVAKTVPLPIVKKEDTPRKIRIYFEGKSISADDDKLKTTQEITVSPEISAPSEKPETVKPGTLPFVPKRISVTLPAAVNDKTFVMIQRKDIDRKQSPVSENNAIVVPSIDQRTSQEPGKNEQVAIQPESINEMQAHAVTHTIIAPIPVEKKEPTPEHHSQEISKPFVFPGKTRSGSSSNLMQQLAVAAAIISILAVFGLLANAILNPDAYNYTMDKKPVTNFTNQQVPVASVAEQTSTEVTELPLKTNLQNPKTEEPAGVKSAVRKNTDLAKMDKATDASVNQESSTDQTVADVPVTIAPSKVEKEIAHDPKEVTRKNINSLVSYQLKNYKVNTFGGVSDFEVTINNGSSYPLDLVVVELKYIQSNKKVYKTERLEFRDVAPNGKQTLGVAKTNRGIKVETAITTISSRDLDLSYNN